MWFWSWKLLLLALFLVIVTWVFYIGRFLFWYVCTKNSVFSFFSFTFSKNDSASRWYLWFYKWYLATMQKVKKRPFCVTAVICGKYNVLKTVAFCPPQCRKVFFYPFANITFQCWLALPQKLDPLCSTNQHVDCLYTHFKYPLSGNIKSSFW